MEGTEILEIYFGYRITESYVSAYSSEYKSQTCPVNDDTPNGFCSVTIIGTPITCKRCYVCSDDTGSKSMDAYLGDLKHLVRGHDHFVEVGHRWS